MSLYLLRHAPVAANRQGIVLGATDPMPDAPGLETFARLTGSLANQGLRRIFSSPLRRAANCAVLLARATDTPLELLPGLAELSTGAFEGRLRCDVRPAGGPLRACWEDRPPGGESLADAEERVARALERVRAELARGPVALVAHAVVNRVVLRQLLDWPAATLCAFAQPHEAIVLVEQEGPCFRLAGWLDRERSLRPGLPGQRS